MNCGKVQARRERNKSSKTSQVPKKNVVVRPIAIFLIVDLRENGDAERTIKYNRLKHVIELPKIRTAEAEDSLKKVVSNFMVDSTILIHNVSVDPNPLQLKMYLRSNKKKRAPKNFL